MDRTMEKEIEKLETALGEFTPAAVPEALEARILDVFAGRQAPQAIADNEPTNIVAFPLWRALGSAAAVAVAIVGVFFAALNSMDSGDNAGGVPLAGDAPPNSERTFVPVRAENVFEGAQEEEFFLTKDQLPVQKVRYQFSDSYLWENPADGTSIEMTVPRERLFIVPVRTD
jgi:hypothetical protein